MTYEDMFNDVNTTTLNISVSIVIHFCLKEEHNSPSFYHVTSTMSRTSFVTLTIPIFPRRPILTSRVLACASPPSITPTRRKRRPIPPPPPPASRHRTRSPPRPPRAPTASRRSWESNYLRLKEYREQHGHAALPRSLDGKLYEWCVKQRAAWKRGKLSVSRYRLLSSLDFPWDAQFAKWKAMFYELAAFRASHGHCNVPLRTGSRAKLARWVVKQRHYHKHGLLRDERRRRLDGIGFSFDPEADAFARRVQQLRSWVVAHGHARVPRSAAASQRDLALARWADGVRQRWRQGRLPIVAHRELRSIGFAFEPHNEGWDAHLSALRSFKERRGHVAPSANEDRRLHFWLGLQRRRYRERVLAPMRAAQLISIGVDLRPPRVAFNEHLAKLELIYQQTGRPDPSVGDVALNLWVTQIRSLGPNRLGASCVRRLRKIAFRF